MKKGTFEPLIIACVVPTALYNERALFYPGLASGATF
jgi:hypothetical protein